MIAILGRFTNMLCLLLCQSAAYLLFQKSWSFPCSFFAFILDVFSCSLSTCVVWHFCPPFRRLFLARLTLNTRSPVLQSLNIPTPVASAMFSDGLFSHRGLPFRNWLTDFAMWRISFTISTDPHLQHHFLPLLFDMSMLWKCFLVKTAFLRIFCQILAWQWVYHLRGFSRSTSYNLHWLTQHCQQHRCGLHCLCDIIKLSQCNSVILIDLFILFLYDYTYFKR